MNSIPRYLLPFSEILLKDFGSILVKMLHEVSWGYVLVVDAISLPRTKEKIRKSTVPRIAKNEPKVPDNIDEKRL